MNSRSYGNKYEQIAADYLEELGYQILDRNWHYSNRGELDIVALDPRRFGEEYLVFIEVKAREAAMRDSLNAVGYHKIQQLKKLAQAYLNFKKLKAINTNISFDVIAFNQDRLEHLKDIV